MAIKISEIDEREKLEEYLKGQPVVLSQLIALRCALRVLPIAGEIFAAGEVGKKIKQDLILSVFRASFISSAAGLVC